MSVALWKASRSTTIFAKCHYQTCFISKGQKMQTFQFKTNLETVFHKIRQVFKHFQNITQKKMTPQDSWSVQINLSHNSFNYFWGKGGTTPPDRQDRGPQRRDLSKT